MAQSLPVSPPEETTLWDRVEGSSRISHIANLEDCQAHLLSKGASNLRFLDGRAEAITGALSGGTYRPQVLLPQRP